MLDLADRHRHLAMLGVVRALDVDDDPYELDEVSAAIVDALDALDETRAARKPLRIPEGFEGGGRFRSVSDVVFQALKDWAEGKGPDNPFDGLKDTLDSDPAKRREQLRRAAKARGLTLRRGATENEIANALLDDARKGKRGDAHDVPDAKPAAKAVKKAAPRRAPAKKVAPRAPRATDEAPVTGQAALDETAVPLRSEAERAAFRDWAGGYVGVNAALRSGNGSIAGGSARDRRIVAGLDSALARSTLDRDIIVTRGIDDLGPLGIGEPTVGAEWTDHGFNSTAALRPHGITGIRPGGAQMRIHVPAGTHAVSGPGLDPDEILLDRGLTYRVTGAERGADGVWRLDVDVVPAGDADADLEQSARDRQVAIDSARRYADVAAQFDETLSNLLADDHPDYDAEDHQKLLRQIDQRVGMNPGVEADIAPIRDAVAAGDIPAARRLMAELLERNGITQDGPSSGERTRFARDGSMVGMTGLGFREGAPVEVVRPGFTLTRDGERVRLSKAVVEEVDELAAPAKATPSKPAVPAESKAFAAAPRLLGTADSPLQARDGAAGDWSLAERRQAFHAVEGYKGPHHIAINGRLRKLDPSLAPPDMQFGSGPQFLIPEAELDRRIALIDQAFEHSALTEDATFWRGFDGRDLFGDRMADDLAGFEWDEPAYVSSSARRDIAEKFAGRPDEGGVLVRMAAPRGVGAIAAEGRDDADSTEAEVMLQRGLKMRVVRDHGMVRLPRAPGSILGPREVRLLDVEVVPIDSPDRFPAEIDEDEKFRRELADELDAEFAGEDGLSDALGPSPDPLSDLRSLDPETTRDALDLRKVDGPDGLKAMLREAGLPTSGRKRDLVDRLVRHLHPTGGDETTPAAPSPPRTGFEARIQQAHTEAAALAAVPVQSSPFARARGLDRLSAEHRRQANDALSDYSGPHFEGVNDRLRSGGQPDPEQQRIIDGIDTAMAESHLTHDVVVYRGLPSGSAMFGDRGDLTGVEWTDDGYVSTSADRDVGEGFSRGGVVMRILAPAGTSAVRFSDMKSPDSPNSEAEILLPRGTRFRVVRDHGRTSPVSTGYVAEGTDIAHFIDVEIVPDDTPTTTASDDHLAPGYQLQVLPALHAPGRFNIKAVYADGREVHIVQDLPQAQAHREMERLRAASPEEVDAEYARNARQMRQHNQQLMAEDELKARRAMRRQQLSGRPPAWLRAQLEALGLDTSGSKSQLIARLLAAEEYRERIAHTVRSADLDPEQRSRVLSMGRLRLADELRAAGHDVTPGHDELHHYWTRGEGREKWVHSPKPWTTLVALLTRHVGPEKAKVFASRWFIEVKGYAAGSDMNRVAHGHPPRGHRVGPG